MDALLMGGGRGTRLDGDVEKPMVEIGGRPMVDRVRDALSDSRIESTIAVVSSHAPETRAHLADLPTIDAPGAGYVADLNRAIARVETPVLTVAADLPLLDGAAVDAVLGARERGPLAVFVPAALKRRLGLSVDTVHRVDGRDLAPAGINVVGGAGDETTYTAEDVRFAVNVNRRGDARVAEELV